MNSRPVLHTLALAAALLCGSAQAVALNKGFAGEPFLDTGLPGTTFAARPELGGLVLEDDVVPFSFASISGTVQSRVVRQDGTGTLDFYWRVNVDRGSKDAITALRIGNFGYDWINDADWRSDSLGDDKPFIGRLFNPADEPTGFFNFVFPDPPIAGGSGSVFMFLSTDAKYYAKTALYDLSTDGSGISSTYATFAPALVPEPSTYALMALGLAAVGAAARRSVAAKA